MKEDELEGSLVLEKLAELGLVDDFYEAIDSDDLKRVRFLLKKASVEATTIDEVLKKIVEGDENW